MALWWPVSIGTTCVGAGGNGGGGKGIAPIGHAAPIGLGAKAWGAVAGAVTVAALAGGWLHPLGVGGWLPHLGVGGWLAHLAVGGPDPLSNNPTTLSLSPGSLIATNLG